MSELGKRLVARLEKFVISLERGELWEILVPTQTNNGTPIRTRQHREWDQRVRSISGGSTIYPVAKGAWKSPSEELFEERMIPVRIACTEEEIEQIADVTADFYDQEAVAYYKVSEDFRIKHYRKKDV